MQNNESKYFYTARLMNEALLYLLEKKDIEFITVTEITKKAGVNRTTFYLHYENVYDLLSEIIGNLNKQFISSFDIKEPINVNTKEDAFLVSTEYLLPYLNFCKEHKRILKLVHQKPHLFQNQEVYKKMYDKILYPAISQFIAEENQKIYFLEFFTQGIVGIINKWIELDCVTEIDIIVKLIMACVKYNA